MVFFAHSLGFVSSGLPPVLPLTFVRQNFRLGSLLPRGNVAHIFESVTSSRIACARESVHFTHQCSLPSILKHALYELVHIEGFSEGGTAGLELFSEDYKVLLETLGELLSSLWVTVAAAPSPQLSDCSMGEPTSTSLTLKPIAQAHTKLVHTSGMFGRYMYDPVCGLQALIAAP